MSIFETNIESLGAKLEGTVKLLELTITRMQEECEDIEGVERRNQAMFFNSMSAADMIAGRYSAIMKIPQFGVFIKAYHNLQKCQEKGLTFDGQYYILMTVKSEVMK